MKHRILLFLSLILFCYSIEIYAQMEIGGNTLYGDEWIVEGKKYYKIQVEQDGLYKLKAKELASAGLSLSSFTGTELAIFHEGKPIPFYVSNDGGWNSDDFLLFKGEKNKAYLDQFMYEGGMEWVLNKEYSLINDVSTYYLVVDEQNAIRYESYENKKDNNLTPKSWHRYTETLEFNEDYHKDYRKASGISYHESHFVENEGWASRNLRTHNLDFIPEDLVRDSLQAELEVRFISDYNEHDLTIRINNDTAYAGVPGRFELMDMSFQVPYTQMRKNRVRLRIRGELAGTDRYRVVYARIKYSRETSSLDGEYFADSLTQNRYYEIGGFEEVGEAWGFSGDKIFRTVVEEGLHIVNGTGLNEGEDMAVYGTIHEAEITSEKVFESIDYSDTELIFLTSERISSSAPSLQEYKGYRESEEGGDFKTAIVHVEDLYDRFAYGVERHPMALKNFMFYLDKAGTDLDYLFIVGKGIQHVNARTEEDFESPFIQEFRVPSFGYPSSDDLLCSPTDRIAPLYAVGRLAYNTEEEIALYLDKVKVNEANYNNPNVEESIWKKRLLHLNAGGVGEHQAIAGHFNTMSNISTNSVLNPRIDTYVKTSNEPIQFTEIESIFKNINEGVKLVTFFGHSSSTSLAFDLDRKGSYANYEQMPFLIALGCSAGNLNIPGRSLGEIYGGYETGGYIGIWSSTHYAFISSLSIVGKNFYEVALNNTEDDRLGMLIKKTIHKSQSQRRVTEQMMYMGDPALRFSIPGGPDPALDSKSISRSPERPTSESAEINIEFEVTNLGTTTSDSILLDYVHTLPDGNAQTVEVGKIRIPEYKDTVVISVPIDSSMAGFNYFDVRINQDRAVEEWPENSAYDNNAFSIIGMDKGYEVYIESGVVTAVYPSDYAIVPIARPEIVLFASPYVGDSMHVAIELDTTRLFNSPIMISETLNIVAGSRRWTVPYELDEDVVYYWRVKSLDDENSEWEGRSFVYLEDKTGWNQSHYYQFRDDEYEGLILNEEREFVQDSFIYSWYVENKLKDDNQGITIYYNGEKLNQGTFWLSEFSGAYIILMDNKTGNLAELCPPGGAYGAINTKSTPIRSFPFDLTVDSSRMDMVNFIENSIPEERNVIVIFHFDDITDSLNVEDWKMDSISNGGKNIFNVLESVGAKSIRELEDKGDVPYGLMYDNQNKRAYAEEVGNDINEPLNITGDIPIPEEYGKLLSTNIINFKNIKILEYGIEIDDSASYHMPSMYIINDSIPVLTDSSQLIANILQLDTIGVDEGKSFQLQWKIGNMDYEVLPQIDYWRIYGDLYGDYLLSAGDQLLNSSEDIRNYDSLKFDFYVQNISHFDLDTGEIEIKLMDENNNELYTERYPLPENIAAFDSLYQEGSIFIDSRSKRLQLHIELIIPEELHELYTNNNTLIKGYYLLQDDIAPFISVYFDGSRIHNGDIVSSKSLIEVEITDKTEIIPLADTSNISFSLLDPDRQLMDYDFSSKDVEFIPGDPHTAFLKIYGDFKEDGVYTFAVNASDKSGNKAGEVEYIVQFRIITENAISYFTNYPNPVHSETRFKYVLTTGDTPPEYSMTIVNASGEVVAMLTEADLGDLRVGEHSTETWRLPGTLPSGIYFYKVDLKTDNSFKHIERTNDRYFTNSWGKMMISP